MAIVQTIEFNSSNEYFAGFLQNAINECDINGSVEFRDNKIKLILDDSDEAALNRFSNYTQKYLPHSIFIGTIDTNVEDVKIKKSNFKSKPYKIAPCPICIEQITNPASDRYLDDTVVCKHYCNDEVTEDKEHTFYSPHFKDNDSVLLTDTSKINELFIVTEDEIKALFSIEKPTLKLTVKSEELKSITGQNYLRVKVPYSIKSTLAALNAKESGIDTLFFNEQDDELSAILVQKNLHMIYDNRVSKQLEPLDEDREMNRFLNIKNEANYKNAIGAYISKTNGISFIVSNEVGTKKAIKFQEFNLADIFEKMKSSKKRARLLENFSSKYPNILEKLEESNLDLYQTIATILEINNPSYESLSNKSLEFRGNGGLKIDMNFKDGGFDYVAMIGSIVSFKLAGVEPHYLAYSIFEAFGDMVISVLGQLKKEFKIDNFILMGDMFENSVLFSRILSKFQISKPYFSKEIALDSKVKS